ncbi:DUF3006 domain-containing protein [Halosolutus amylolyticus]|uniref:DUF3006 domain-containing protein n=1 Tax=Halosolutus amylolyticus TaxID=2932267 RepID=A0ABD5PL61_9EURY|nr:DUF3006 domain-containing protein [Halosolutus amylolyticus]
MPALTPMTRRSIVRTLGASACATMIATTSVGARTDSDRTTDDDESTAAERYVAVVDRIVDGRHVVLLLEEEGKLVDQHVEPASEMPDVEEGDVLHVVVKDGDLCTYQHLPERPGEPADSDGIPVAPDPGGGS